jgi:hypothetical protein
MATRIARNQFNLLPADLKLEKKFEEAIALGRMCDAVKPYPRPSLSMAGENSTREFGK